MKFLILLAVVFALSLTALEQDAFGILGCNDPHCYSLIQSDRIDSVQGIEYKLDAPDLWVDRTTCQNIAVSTGWLVADSIPLKAGPEWVESGVTKGDVRNVGCVTELSTYYAINTSDTVRNYYQEFLVSNGRVDPGDNVSVTLQKFLTNQVQVYLITPDLNSQFPIAQVSLDSRNVYHADFGIEGTISAFDEYSSIPMSKFTDIKIKQNDSWIDLPSSASLYTIYGDDGYLGKKCSDTSFVAGSVMSLDCNVVTVRNQAPLISTQIINLNTNAPITISLDGVDTDKDYLIYNLVEIPTNGFLDYNNLGQKIPNTDGDSSQLVYTPANLIPESDIIRYSVTDGRDAHTREGLISIIGPTPAPTISDAVDDFAYSVSDNVIHFTWSHPHDGGSAITSYRIERSVDTESWQLHDTISEDNTSLDYLRSEGYDRYFRIFANNVFGFSAPSNILHVHITDTTPPEIRINTPTDGDIITDPFVFLDGIVSEPNNSGIEDIAINIDGLESTDQIVIDIVSDFYYNIESVLTGLSNGDHFIEVTAQNGDGIRGSNGITVILDVPVSTTIDSFYDDFETDMSKWFVMTDDDENWSIRSTPIVPIPDLEADNKVAGTEDCDDVCTMTMIDNVDLTQMLSPTLNFYRYVSVSADLGEGIIVYVSEDGGNNWSTLERFTADNSSDDGLWHFEEYDLDSYDTSNFKLKFEAVSSGNSEDTEIDEVRVYDAHTDIISPLNLVPIAIIISPDSIFSGNVVTLDASNSYDLDGQIESYTWTQTDDSEYVVYLDVTNPELATFVAPDVIEETTLTFELMVHDGINDSEPVQVSINIIPNVISFDAPYSILANRGDSQVELNWSAPKNTGNSVISDYVIEYTMTLEDESSWETFDDANRLPTNTSATVTELENGNTYYFRIMAMNQSGDSSEYSEIISAYPATAPGPVTNKVAISTENSGEIYLTWNAPDDDGGYPIIDYVILYRESGSYIFDLYVDGTSDDTFVTIIGLESDVKYFFEVYAVTEYEDDDAFGTPKNMILPEEGTGTGPELVSATPR